MMASKKVVTSAIQHVKPILSVDRSESRRRVLNLYKTWYRQIPYIVFENDIPKNIEQCRAKLREEFYKHKDVTDIRVIDMLVIKGQMALKEIVNMWIHKGGIMHYWKETYEPKPTDFLSKFMSGSS